MARGQPITWRNVNIDNGASAAAFGNTAANFGRTALQGFSILDDQLQKRIDTEDSRLTNEAIAAALQGGPRVSNNRRVDADALQLAVERQTASRRADQQLESNLAGAELTQEGQRISNQVAQFDLDNYDEDRKLRMDFENARLEATRNQTRESKLRYQELEKQIADRDRIRKGRDALNQYLYGTDLTNQYRADWDQRIANDPALAGLSDAEKEAGFRQFADDQRRAMFRDPNKAQQLAVQFGMAPIELFQYTAFGQEAKAAQDAANAAEAELAVQGRANRKAEITAINNTLAGKGDFYWDDTRGDWAYGTAAGTNKDHMESVLRSNGLDPDDDKVQEFRGAVHALFPSKSAFDKVVSGLVKDGKIPSNFKSLIQDQYDAVQENARSRLRGDEQYGGSLDPEVNFQNWAASRGSTVYAPAQNDQPTDPVVDLSGGVSSSAGIISDPDTAVRAIQEINNQPTTAAAQKESQQALDTSVASLNEAATQIKMPKNASDELRALNARLQEELKIANGKKATLRDETNTLGIAGIGGIDRPVQPRFHHRQASAAESVKLVQQVLQKIREENAAAEQKKYTDQLR